MNERQKQRARQLLEEASKERRPLDQRLKVAAAFTCLMATPPTVVGGTAEEYWARDQYHPTDLDLIPGPTAADVEAFRQVGLKKEGRHWVQPNLSVGTEFPHDSTFEVRRTKDELFAGVVVKIIGVDDLYLDRLQQTTMTGSTTDQHFSSLLAIAVANWDQLDWPYIDDRVAEIKESRQRLGESMQKMSRSLRRIARRQLALARAESL